MKGRWSDIADRFGLTEMHSGVSEKATARDIFTKNDRVNLLGEDESQILPEDLAPWPEDMAWRNIKGNIVKKSGGFIYYDEAYRESRLLLKVLVNGKMAGFIRANIVPKERRNYFNSKGKSWAKNRGLFPYDLVKRRVSKRSIRIVYLVEGPRDSLNLVQNGLLGLAILGTKWTEGKHNLLKKLNPDMVVLMYDNDDAGKKAAKNTIELSGNNFVIRRFRFTNNQDGTKFDASDLSKEQCRRIEQHYQRKAQESKDGN
jgi:5S rRNA maturation endonuclease (ribonuclease M5)